MLMEAVGAAIGTHIEDAEREVSLLEASQAMREMLVRVVACENDASVRRKSQGARAG